MQAAMDGTNYMKKLTELLKHELFCVEVPCLLEKHGEQFPQETVTVLCNLLQNHCCDENGVEEPVRFDLLRDVQTIGELWPEIIRAAFKGKCWVFVKDTMHSDWYTLFLREIMCQENLCGFVKYLYALRDDLGTSMVKLCHLLLENGMHNLVRDMVDSDTIQSGGPDVDLVIFAYKCLVKDSSKDHLRKVLEAVGKDDRYGCQYLTLLLAARLKQWMQVTQIVKAARFDVIDGSDEVFVRAMCHKAWTCAAVVLHSVMQVQGVSDTGILLDIQAKAEIRLFGQPDFKAVVLKPFIDKAIQCQRCAAGALVAAWARSWGYVRLLLGHLQQGTADPANIIVLEELMRNLKFHLVYKWLRTAGRPVLQPRYADSLMWEAAVNCRHERAKALVEQCLPWCEDSSIVGEAMYHIVLYCQSDLLRKFLARGVLQHSPDMEFALSCAVEMCCSTWPSDGSYRQHPRFHILLACLEAGCSHYLYQSESFSLDAVVKRGVAPLLQLLFDTGCISSSAVHNIRLCYDVVCDLIPRKRAEEIAAFLQQAESTPHSLKALCSFTVSQQLGCGADRKHRGLALGLPMHLTQQVLLMDVLYPGTVDVVESLIW